MTMNELVGYIARTIVSNPDEVKVTEETDADGNVIIRLEVHPDDKGKIIGRQGRVAQAIRTLLRVAAVKRDVRVSLEIL